MATYSTAQAIRRLRARLEDALPCVEYYHDREGTDDDQLKQIKSILKSTDKEVLLSVPHVVLVCEGGLVKDVFSTVPCEVLLVDYDVEGAPKEELTELPSIGTWEPAAADLRSREAIVVPRDVLEFFRIYDDQETFPVVEETK